MKKEFLFGRFFLFFLILISFLCCPASHPKITTYVALGDSLTAGYQNDSLVGSFQKFSFPNLIAKQLGIEDFYQPLISQPGIPSVLEIVSLKPLNFSRREGFGQQLNPDLSRPYDNLGIPGATLYSALHPEDLASRGINPFYDYVLRGRGNAIEQAISLKPELVTFWFGNNEILSGVTSGRVVPGETVFLARTYAGLLDKALAELSRSGAKMAIGNIIDLTEIPYVTYLPIYISDPETGELLRDASGNYVPYLGDEGPLFPGWRITLGGLGFIKQGEGIPEAFGGNGRPLSSEVTLSPREISELKTLIAEYNAVIARAAKKYGAALVDLHNLYADIKIRGFSVSGKTFFIDFPSGGLVSSDAIHPTSLGYAIIANEFIRRINETFGYRIPLIPFENLTEE